ncbi:MAG: hypothetical protein ACRCXB_31300 [Aeromonadaceae bacterium]
MTDKEMLEMAAMANGMLYGWEFDEEISGMVSGKNKDGKPYPYMFAKIWRPLHDDGDALRLAVKLCIDVSHDAIGMKSFVYARTAFNDENHIGLSEIFDVESERLERARRAITRAAAQIGKEMK